MNQIAILCASDTELAPFFRWLENVRVSEKAMLKFYEGSIGEAKVVALYSGVCRVNAALAAQILIDDYHVDAIINAGTAGGMDERARLFDTVVSEQAAYHDVADDILTEFHPWLKTVYFQSDAKLLAAARRYSERTPYPILFGKTVTGERFVTDKDREAICRRFSPLSTDMETAGIAHVCYVNQVPFLAIRTITDTPGHDGIETFEENSERASGISAEIAAGVIGELQKSL